MSQVWDAAAAAAAVDDETRSPRPPSKAGPLPTVDEDAEEDGNSDAAQGSSLSLNDMRAIFTNGSQQQPDDEDSQVELFDESFEEVADVERTDGNGRALPDGRHDILSPAPGHLLGGTVPETPLAEANPTAASHDDGHCNSSYSDQHSDTPPPRGHSPPQSRPASRWDNRHGEDDAGVNSDGDDGNADEPGGPVRIAVNALYSDMDWSMCPPHPAFTPHGAEANDILTDPPSAMGSDCLQTDTAMGSASQPAVADSSPMQCGQPTPWGSPATASPSTGSTPRPTASAARGPGQPSTGRSPSPVSKRARVEISAPLSPNGGRDVMMPLQAAEEETCANRMTTTVLRFKRPPPTAAALEQSRIQCKVRETTYSRPAYRDEADAAAFATVGGSTFKNPAALRRLPRFAPEYRVDAGADDAEQLHGGVGVGVGVAASVGGIAPGECTITLARAPPSRDATVAWLKAEAEAEQSTQIMHARVTRPARRLDTATQMPHSRMQVPVPAQVQVRLTPGHVPVQPSARPTHAFAHKTNEMGSHKDNSVSQQLTLLAIEVFAECRERAGKPPKNPAATTLAALSAAATATAPAAPRKAPSNDPHKYLLPNPAHDSIRYISWCRLAERCHWTAGSRLLLGALPAMGTRALLIWTLFIHSLSRRQRALN